ncbi:MAG: hypothetical protein LUD17_16730 [Bacteroidales bacterium]|nr:hypothetical protein [Bacteroidales bacterium]
MVDFSIPTLPCLLGLMVAAYVLVITVFYNQELRAKINPQYKRELMTTLNRTFAIALMVPAVSLVLTCFVGLIMSFEIPCEYADFINGSVFWLLLTMVTYSLLIIYGIAIDLFNIAQCSVKLD